MDRNTVCFRSWNSGYLYCGNDKPLQPFLEFSTGCMECTGLGTGPVVDPCCLFKLSNVESPKNVFAKRMENHHVTAKAKEQFPPAFDCIDRYSIRNGF